MDAGAVEEQRGEVREDAQGLRRRHVEPEDRADSKGTKDPRQQIITTPAGVALCRDREAGGSADA